MMSPFAAAKPVLSAAPFPRPSCATMRMSPLSCRATEIVSSVEWPSTSTTSSTESSILGRTYGKFAASFSAGITTVIVGRESAGALAEHADATSARVFGLEPARFRARPANAAETSRF